MQCTLKQLGEEDWCELSSFSNVLGQEVFEEKRMTAVFLRGCSQPN